MSESIKVAVYEDNDALRTSLTYLIKGTEVLAFAGAFSDAGAILEHCARDCPKVILMDIAMPGISGIEATRMVKKAFPEIEVMMLTVFEDSEMIFDALSAGATGYLLKKASAIRIVEAIVELAHGGSPISHDIARKVLEFFSTPGGRKIQNTYSLSERERQVLERIVAGDSYKMIADHCCISMGTVRSHINSVYRKLAVNSKSEAVIKALKEHLI